jgi:hypothetical protein
MNLKTLNVGLSVATLCFAAAGCGPPYRCVPVSGHVTVDGKPLPYGAISFAPDTSRGNTHRVNPVGEIDEDGSYEVSTEAKPGAPVGWYKVVIRTQIPGDKRPDHVVKIDPKFSDPSRTPLSVEIVENPDSGAYDLKVTRADPNAKEPKDSKGKEPKDLKTKEPRQVPK